MSKQAYEFFRSTLDEIRAAGTYKEERVITTPQGARIDTWGVGTRLVTAYDQPALGGVYKLGAIRPAGGEWRPVIKAGEQVAKVSVPGILGVRRYQSGPSFVGGLRRGAESAPAVAELPKDDYLDIPAFLRRQAD